MEDCSLPHDSLFLGFDSSTQSLKATVLDSNLNLVTSEIVHFDSQLPHYRTRDGVYRDASENGRIVSPTLIGQQHGSVYWKSGSSAILSSLDPSKPLVGQLGDAFSTKDHQYGWTAAPQNNAER
ncbi:Xylulose kinase [Vitis vinifera]|uniref:Xylulose kinase n=1 Tax=Vitis vinifera TaxID=29760 RepID=A0A438KML4_VITVI|nr:Xylulose kinase [Vitis vinifera]